MTPRVPVGSLFALTIGGGWGADEPAPGLRACRVIRGTDMAGVRLGSLDGAPLRYETDKRLTARELRTGDVILEISGGSTGQATGRTVLVTESLLRQAPVPVIPASFCRLLRPDASVVVPRYLYYWLQDMYRSGRVWSYQNQSTGIANLQMQVFSNAELVRLPPLAEQGRIAGVLGVLDDLIETNVRTVGDLERLGKVFVASAVLDGGPTELTLDGVCSVIESGRRPRGGVKGISSGVPSLGAESVNGLKPFDFAKTRYVPREFAGAMRRGVVEDLDVLVYKDGGKPGEFYPDVSVVGAGYPFSSMVINEHVFRVRAAAPLGQGYLYYLLSTDVMMARMKEAGSRTAAIPGMNSTNFGNLPVAVPSVDWCATYMPILDDLVKTALALLAECRDLASQRDQLLPLLMAGKVRVSELVGVG